MDGHPSRKARSVVASASLVVGLAVGLVTPAIAQTSTAPAKVVFNIGQTSDVTSLNPYNLCCSWDYSYLVLSYDLAFGYGPDLSPAPSIISAWEHSTDYLTWTLTVRDDATWQDGEPLTAEDVAFSFSLIADNAMPFYKDYLPFDPTFEVVDPTTILWKSTEPTFAPEVPPYIPVVPEHIWGKLVVPGDAKETRAAVKEFSNDPAIGSGPFELVEWKKGQFLRFEANPDYWGGPPAGVDELVVKVYENQEAMAQAIRSGEIDYASGLNAALYDSVIQDPSITGHVADGGWWNDLAFNFGGQGDAASNHPAIQDVTVRQAVELAIDKQAIVDKVYQGLATVGDSILLPSQGFWYHPIPEDLKFSYDPTRANQLLDDAGYADSDGDGVREMPDGSDPLRWEIMSVTDVNGSPETGQLIKGYLAKIGIDVKLFSVNTNKAYDVWGAGDFDAYVWGWGSDPDPDFILSVFTSGQCLGWSDGCYSNPEYDAMYSKQQVLFDRGERKAQVDQMQEFLAEQVPTIVLTYQTTLEVYRNERFTGFLPSPDVESGVLMLSGYETRSIRNIAPVGEAGTAPVASQGLSGWVWVAAIGGLAVVGGVFVAARRRKVDEEA